MTYLRGGFPRLKGLIGVDAQEMTRYIRESFPGVRVAENAGDAFFIHDPDGDLPAERGFPFATVVTGDHYDQVSRLDRPGVYRVNIGLTKARYSELFGAAPTTRDGDGVWETGFDYSTVDTLLPHPVYAGRHWVCVVSPGPATLDTVRDLLAEAHRFAVHKHANQRARRTRS
ncbi:DUF6194 family protein [Actinokineospora iranica]|uniref:DUF6194 domain-containing protein n=1 Tax=Actinokineospora iranica TaxID=1271860 RepID=A0A1G6XN46_9PSEU|nr:DUF6194 family protein [Actinokineospora iranica]SDD79411.1 hypothetical protein SAMN05216174_11832 [Actinokineospora iranica]